jgi:hypothetical protein
MAPIRTAENTLLMSRLNSAQHDPTPIVNTFTSFSQRHISSCGLPQSISQLMNHRHLETPTRTPSGLPPDDEDPDDGDDDTPGGNPPDDNPGDDDDDNDDLNPQHRFFLWLSEAINNLAWNSHHTSISENSKVKI